MKPRQRATTRAAEVAAETPVSEEDDAKDKQAAKTSGKTVGKAGKDDAQEDEDAFVSPEDADRKGKAADDGEELAEGQAVGNATA